MLRISIFEATFRYLKIVLIRLMSLSILSVGYKTTSYSNFFLQWHMFHLVLLYCFIAGIVNNAKAVEFRCDRPGLLAPGSQTRALDGAFPFVEHLYSRCLGLDRCYLGNSTIKAALGDMFKSIMDLTNATSSLPSKLLKCTPGKETCLVYDCIYLVPLL